MAKPKTSIKQKELLRKKERMNKNTIVLKECDPVKELLNEEKFAQVVAECIKDNDLEGLMEAVEIYLYAHGITPTTTTVYHSSGPGLKNTPHKDSLALSLAQLLHESSLAATKKQ